MALTPCQKKRIDVLARWTTAFDLEVELAELVWGLEARLSITECLVATPPNQGNTPVNKPRKDKHFSTLLVRAYIRS